MHLTNFNIFSSRFFHLKYFILYTMSFDLDLGLAFHDYEKRENKNKKMESKNYLYLSLGPSKDDDEEITITQNSLTSPSIDSSISNSMNTMKKETCEEFEVEIEKVPLTRIGNVDEYGNSRKKLRLTKQQSQVLEQNFRDHSTLNQNQKQALAERLKLQARQVEVWFQNRRARTKVKQTESDFEVLKKCCETLTEENKNLKKEVQELKSMQAPFYVQIPAATLTLCPLCGTNKNGSKAR
ncbi:unnamed protein product [Vicia faba]|uniref:Homeobox domain-containing protein n=1 Tax=Vicia faba TaxID=3906 RepID=A0AAV1A6E5_VICFA|nr:unnamed protein product [Vicia faba]